MAIFAFTSNIVPWLTRVTLRCAVGRVPPCQQSFRSGNHLLASWHRHTTRLFHILLQPPDSISCVAVYIHVTELIAPTLASRNNKKELKKKNKKTCWREIRGTSNQHGSSPFLPGSEHGSSARRWSNVWIDYDALWEIDTCSQWGNVSSNLLIE